MLRHVRGAKMEGDFSELRVPFRLAPEHPLPNFHRSERRLPVRVRVAVPPSGFGERFSLLYATILTR